MAVRKGNSGILLIETALLIELLIFGLFWGHVQIVKLWREKIKLLQGERIKYDGEIKWESIRD